MSNFELLAGTILNNKFQLLEKLGEGASGTVYKAIQLDLSRKIALKILDFSQSLNKESFLRFKQEAKILAQIQHPNIVTIFSFGLLAESKPYIAMELLAGETLAKQLATKENLTWKDTLDIGIECCEALKFAHRNGIVHRDLKPANIFILDSSEKISLKVLDFGLAKFIYENKEFQKLTQTGELLGTLNYMSPEQCQGKKADQRSDIYSLSCILYECLAGKPVFKADNALALMHEHINASPKKLEPKPKDNLIPQSFEIAIFKGLEKNAECRYQSVEELEETLLKIRSNPNLDLKQYRVNVLTQKNFIGLKHQLLILICATLISSSIFTLYLIDQNKKQVNSKFGTALNFNNNKTQSFLESAKQHLAQVTKYNSKNLERKTQIELKKALLDFICAAKEINIKNHPQYAKTSRILSSLTKICSEIPQKNTSLINAQLEELDREENPVFPAEFRSNLRYLAGILNGQDMYPEAAHRNMIEASLYSADAPNFSMSKKIIEKSKTYLSKDPIIRNKQTFKQRYAEIVLLLKQSKKKEARELAKLSIYEWKEGFTEPNSVYTNELLEMANELLSSQNFDYSFKCFHTAALASLKANPNTTKEHINSFIQAAMALNKAQKYNLELLILKDALALAKYAEDVPRINEINKLIIQAKKCLE